MVRRLKLQVVVEDTASRRDHRLLAQHGLCLFLEADLGSEKMRLLMDTGASADVTLHNLDLLGIDPEGLDQIFLSHGHYDHTGGLLGVLGRSKHRIPVLGHPVAFEPKLKTQPFLKFIGPPFSREEAESSGAVMLLSSDPIPLAPGITTSGQVDRITSFESVEGFYTVRDGCYLQDNIPDDQSLIVDIEGRGLAVITGCAHAGVINTILRAKKLTGSDKVYAVLGGFHLLGASRERIDRTAAELGSLDPEIIRPGHCTGGQAAARLQEVLGDRCQPLSTGDLIEL
jgi:7,8-dihydropterin-6-yl-methyl-4-(beta-D-ribofuranosyl)aminobenzene 5'-phosphate synthase